jgi:glycosyltransferase involved in cell wall biosynthesis
MRILLVSKFLHPVGGVETYLSWQAETLAAAGFEVGIMGMEPPPGSPPVVAPALPTWRSPLRSFAPGAPGRLRSALSSVYSPTCGRVMTRAIDEFRPDVVHFHGTCYQLTPSVVTATVRRRVPSFLTVHDYKLLCVNQSLFDDRVGSVCTDCLEASALGKFVRPVRRSCMKGSTLVTGLGAVEGQLSTAVWRRADPTILAPSHFIRSLLLADGWPADRVHYLDLPWPARTPDADPAGATRDSVLFLGRLLPEKGPVTLLDAWSQIAGRHPDVHLRIAGDGVQRQELQDRVATRKIPRVHFLGFLSPPQAARELGRALLTAHPAIWLENSPFSVRESLAAGVPAVVSARGGMPELVGSASGYVVEEPSVDAWAAALDRALDERTVANPKLQEEVAGRVMTADAHLEALLAHYRAALGRTTPPDRPGPTAASGKRRS